MADEAVASVYLVHGEDTGLVSQRVSGLVGELTEALATDASAVEEYGSPGRDEPLALGPVLDACRTPPFLSSHRVVVVRDGAGLDADQQRELLAYLKDPVPTTVLVVAHPGRNAPAVLTKAFASAGTVLAAAPAGGAKGRSEWFAERLRDAPVRLDAGAARLVREHLGEDLSRLEGLLNTLESAYGPRQVVTADELEPFLGTAGGVAPWDLTDAIDAGDTPAALDAVRRLLGGGERHPLQVLATLNRHFGAMLALDGAGVADDVGAARLTGMSPFPARKALAQSRRLGHAKIARTISLLAAADLDLRGVIGWPPELVIEVLVARLSQLTRLGPQSGAGRARTARG